MFTCFFTITYSFTAKSTHKPNFEKTVIQIFGMPGAPLSFKIDGFGDFFDPHLSPLQWKSRKYELLNNEQMDLLQQNFNHFELILAWN